MLMLINLVLYFFWFTPGETLMQQSVNAIGESLARSLSFEATSLLLAEDRIAISNLLNRYAEDPTVTQTSISTLTNDLQLFSRQDPTTESGRMFRRPILMGDELLGYAELYASERSLSNWQSQAISSWVLFNLLSIGGLGILLYWRFQKHHKTLQHLSDETQKLFPDIGENLSGSSEQQFSQLLHRFSDSLTQQTPLFQYLRSKKSLSDEEIERLVDQINLVQDSASYKDVALLSIQCQNWDALIRQYDAGYLEQLWQSYEELMIQVGELYQGVLLPDGFTLVFGLQSTEEFAFQAICAARVLQLALKTVNDDASGLKPQFSISLSGGPAFVGKTHKHALPMPLIVGDAEVWLSQVKSLQMTDTVLLAEPLLQYKEVNDNLEASLLRDITLSDGSRLEVWEIDQMKHDDDLLMQQASTLATMINAKT